jgi:hypothetical protein
VPATIGARVAIGHRAIVHGATIEDDCLVGMAAVVLNRVVVGRGSIIAAGAVVPERTVIPPHSLVIGVPGRVTRRDDGRRALPRRAHRARATWRCRTRTGAATDPRLDERRRRARPATPAASGARNTRASVSGWTRAGPSRGAARADTDGRVRHRSTVGT